MQNRQHQHLVPERRDIEGRLNEGAHDRRRLGLLLGGLALRGLSPGWALAGVLSLVPCAFGPSCPLLRRIRIYAEIACG